MREIAVNLHHLPDTVKKVLAGIDVTYSHEEDLLGTSGALHPLQWFLEGNWFWTINAKIITSDIPPFQPQLTDKDEVITSVLVKAQAGAPYTRVEVNNNNPPEIVGFKPASDQDGSGYLFTGIQLVSPRIWDFLPQPGFSHFTTDVYPKVRAFGGRVAAFLSTSSWSEFSTLQRYLDHHIACSGATWSFWGADHRVHSTCRVEDSVLWDQVTVERGAIVKECVLADGVVIRSGRRLERVAVVSLDMVDSVEKGEVLDDNLIVAIPR